MENIKKFLELIYNSDNGMLYFYVITGSIALILIVLIIINIKKGKKQAKEDIQVESKPASEPKAQENIDEEKIEVQSVIDEKTKEEQKVEEVIEETNISNYIPKNEDVKEIEHEDNNEVKVNDVDALDALYENQENKIKESNEDEIELPKFKENSNLSSESFMERLNALKNK